MDKAINSIAFLLPASTKLPAGGYKVIFDYANRLADRGFDVHIVYAGSLFWSRKSLRFKLSGILRYIISFLSGFSSKRWYCLSPSVKEHLTFSLNYRHIPKTDLYVCSTPFTAMYLKEYPVEERCKFYFIQGYENWGGVSDKTLRETYRYNMNKIVVSQWLGDILSYEGEEYVKIPNGFNHNIFKISIKPESRSPYKISMVYSPIKCKDFRCGWSAIEIVKGKIPELSVEMFSTEPKPNFIPEWVNYHECPSQHEIVDIYNSTAIFVASSKQEGWGLTIGEAMSCGCAVVCTDNKGYLEMAIDGKTALVSPTGNCVRLADNIMKLIFDNGYRLDLAYSGNSHIKNFSLENSFDKFIRIISGA